MQLSLETLGLNPDVVKRNMPLFQHKKVVKACAIMVNNNPELFFTQRAREVMKEITNATSIMDAAIDHFDKSYEKFRALETSINKDIKTKAGNIKDAEEKLMQGLARIEKAANFDRLEKYVALIERASTAMKLLAELEKDGKLEKIASAIR